MLEKMNFVLIKKANILSISMFSNIKGADYLLVNNDQDVIGEMNCLKNPIGCGIMFRLKHLIELGLYNTKFLRREDEELINRFKIKYNISRVAIPLYRYRRHENNITNDKKTMKKFKKKLNLRNK